MLNALKSDPALHALWVGILLSPLCLAGATATASIAIAALWLAILGFVLWHSSFSFGVTTKVLFGVWGFTLIQRLPLPASWLAELECGTLLTRGDIATSLSRASGEKASEWTTFSLDPVSTSLALLTLSSAIAAYWAASILIQNGRRRNLQWAIIWSTAVVAVVTMIHTIFGATQVWGIYRPSFRPFPFGPVLNINHFAALCALGAILAFAEGLRERRLSYARKVYWPIAFFLTLAAMQTVSRGHFVFFLVGIPLFLFTWKAREPNLKQRVVIGTIACGILGGVALLLSGTGARMWTEGYQKYQVALDGLSLALDFPFLGVGRGAFGVAYTSLMNGDRFPVPENIVAHWGAEWGLVVGGGLFIALVRRLWKSHHANRRSAGRAMAFAAMSAWLVQNLVDFNLEMPGIAVLGAVLFACVDVRKNSERDSDEFAEGDTSRTASTKWGWGLFSAMACVFLFAAVDVGDSGSIEEKNWQLNQLAEKHPHEARKLAIRWVKRHPREPAFALMAGGLGVSLESSDAFRWLNHTLFMAPTWGEAHVQVARGLIARGFASQALASLAEAKHTPAFRRANVLCDAWPVGIPVDKLASAAATEKTTEWLDVLTTCAPTKEIARIDAYLANDWKSAPPRMLVRASKQARHKKESLPEAARRRRRILIDALPRTDTRTNMTLAGELHLEDTLQRFEEASSGRRMAIVAAERGRFSKHRVALLVECAKVASSTDINGARDLFSEARARATEGPEQVAIEVAAARSERSVGEAEQSLDAYVRAVDLGANQQIVSEAYAYANEVGDLTKRARFERFQNRRQK